MTKRFAPALAAFALLFCASAGSAQEAPAATPLPEEPAPELARVAIVTEMGTIEVDLDLTNAPVTSRNFLRYAAERRFDGATFYRVMRLDWGQQPNGLIQGGTRADPKRDLPGIAHEPTSQTGIRHLPGAISMARFAPGTAKGDFTIMVSDMTGLDAHPRSDDPERQAGYAAFGNVSSGMDVVRAIFDVPMSPTEGEGVMKGQIIANPVKIIRVRQVARPQPAAQSVPADQAAPAPAQ